MKEDKKTENVAVDRVDCDAQVKEEERVRREREAIAEIACAEVRDEDVE